MIKNDSVKKLQTVRNFYLAFWIIGEAAFVITTIVSLSQTAGANVGLSILLVLGIALLIGIAGYIGLCVIDHFIYRRQENIDYMNARLEHLNGKKTIKSDKKEAK